MAFETAVGSLSTGTSGTVSVSGLSFQPKAVILWWSGTTSTTDAAGGGTHTRGAGFATSTSSRRVCVNRSGDAGTSAVTDSGYREDACIASLSSAGAIDGLVDVQSFNSDGFTLVHDDGMPASFRVHYLALGGADLTDTFIGTLTEPAAAGTQQISGVGFQPDCLIIIACPAGTGSPPIVAVDSRLQVGVAVRDPAANYTWSGGSNDAATTMQCLSYCWGSGESFSAIDGGVANIDSRGSISAWDSDGFDINWAERGSGVAEREYFFLALKGGKYFAGDLLTATNTTAFAETGVGFTPKGALFLSHCKTESTANAGQDDDEWSMGAVDSALNQRAMGTLDDDNAADAEVALAVEHDEVYINISLADAKEGGMKVNSLDSDGFTLQMTTADPAQSFVWFLAFGNAGAAADGAIAATGTVSGTSSALAASAGAVSGSGTPAATGASLAAGAGSIAGTGAVSGTGAARAEAEGACAATSAVTGGGASSAAAAGTVSNAASVAGTGAALGIASGAIAAASTVAGVAPAFEPADGAISSAATVAGEGASLAASAGAFPVSGSVSGVGTALAAGAGVIGGTAAVAATGAAIGAGAGTVAGSSDCAGSGASSAQAGGAAACSSAVAGAGAATADSAATCAGASSVAGGGASLAASPGTIQASATLVAGSAAAAASAGALAATSAVTATSGGSGDADGSIASSCAVQGGGGALASADASVVSVGSVTGSGSALSGGAGASPCSAGVTGSAVASAAAAGQVDAVASVAAVSSFDAPPTLPPRTTFFSAVDASAPTASTGTRDASAPRVTFTTTDPGAPTIEDAADFDLPLAA